MALRSNPIQYSALEEDRVPEPIKDQIEESIIRFARRRLACSWHQKTNSPIHKF